MADPGLDVYIELPLVELALLLELRVELHAESREPGRLFNVIGLAILL